jgi:hypothetical protein
MYHHVYYGKQGYLSWLSLMAASCSDSAQPMTQQLQSLRATCLIVCSLQALASGCLAGLGLVTECPL